MPAATARSWRVRIISRPVRSPTWARRGWVCPPNGRWRIRPSRVRSKTAPQRLELAHPVGRLLGVELGHPRVVEHLAADHRVAEMDLPRVVRGDVAEGRGDAAFGHHRVGLAQERLADQPDVGPGLGRRDRRSQPRATGADDQDVVRTARSGPLLTGGWRGRRASPRRAAGRTGRPARPRRGSPRPSACG